MIVFMSDIWRSATDDSCRGLWSYSSDTKHSDRNPHKQVSCHSHYQLSNIVLFYHCNQ